MRAVLALLLATCATSPASLVLTERVIALVPATAQGTVQAVLVAPDGRPLRVWVTRLLHPGDHLVAGQPITAWCHVAGVDTVADSVRVEP